MHGNLKEVLIMYEVSSFSVPHDKEELMQEVVEKANRLLGVQKLALYEKRAFSYKVLKQWGFQDRENLFREIKEDVENSFLYPLDDGKLGYLYLEQYHPLSPQSRRLFTVFARQIENALRHLHAGEKLEQSEKEKAVILDSISEALVFQDRDHRVLWVNRAAADQAGLSSDEIIGSYCARVFNHVPETCPQCPLSGVLESGRSKEGFIYTPDGKYWYLRGFPVKTSAGEVGGLVEVAMDITGKKKAEEELQHSRRIFEMVFNSVNDAIFVLDENGTILDVNDTMLRMFGLESREEARKYTIRDYSGSDNDFSELERVMKKAAAGESYLFEWEARYLRSGTTFEVEIFVNSLALDNRNLILATVRDITARKHEEKLLRNLFTYSPIGMYVVNRGRFSMINSQFEKITGYTEAELKGKRALDIVLPDCRKKVYRNAVKMLKEVENSPYEFRIIAKNGEIRWVVESVASITFHGEIATLGSIMDITERKKAEEKLNYLSFHDSLTGLYNRTYLDQEMERLDTERQLPISIIIADLNGLKLANDTYGHGMGDKVLKRAARVLEDSCRKEDIVARWGGDEFMVFLTQTGEEAVQQ